MSLEIGIVGLSNVGKSTLFNALTKANVPAMNYPFCTIEPNVGVVLIPDQMLLDVAAIVKPKQVTGAVIKFVDIAGLVQGASRGEGLGNKFLAHIREVDAILHIVRVFSDPNVVKVEGNLDPISDIEIVETELILTDLQTIANRIDKTTRLLKTGEKHHKIELAALEQAQELLNQGQTLRNSKLDLPADLNLLTIKPVLYVLNTNETTLLEPDTLEELQQKLRDRTGTANSEAILVSASLELELAELEVEEAQSLRQELGIAESGVDKIIDGGTKLLDLVTFYTIKGDETRGWLVPRGTLAPQAAGTIHTDMERGFIKAEVISAESLLEIGGFVKARELGQVKLEGKDYAIQDGDVVLFHFNV